MNATLPVPSPEERRLDRLAQRRARAKAGWFVHATIYVLVNLLLIVLALTRGRPWTPLPLLGWGLGLTLHAVSVWVLALGNPVMQRMIEREREQLRQASR